VSESQVTPRGEEPPMPEAEAVIEEYMPDSAELVLRDPDDEHERFLVMDAHDVAQMVQWAQESALRKWVYELPDGKLGLSIHGVQDLIQQMNWRGKCRIGTLPETLTVEQVTADEGEGPEPFWVATIFARDDVTGAMLPGSAMEPQRMKLRASTAERYRREGKKVPDDNKIFDRFSRTKAINKAVRNALAAFIPEEVEQTILGMFSRDSSRVERIRTEAEQKVAELPPPLTDEQAQAQVERARALYGRIRELHGGRGKVEVTPATFNAWLMAAQHSHDRLNDLIGHLEHLLETLPGKLAEMALREEATDSAREVPCPACGAQRRQFCRGVRGVHPERVAARMEALRAAAEEAK